MEKFNEICWNNHLGLKEFLVVKKGVLKFIEEKYNPPKTTIEISDLIDFFGITDKEITKELNN